MRRLTTTVAIVVALSSSVAAQQPAGETVQIRSVALAQRPTIAIRDLDFAAQLARDDLQELNQWDGLAVVLGRGTGSRMEPKTIMDQLAKQLSQMLTQSIMDTENFRIFERPQLGAAIDEQDLGKSNRAAPGQNTAESGKIVTAQYVVTGAITKFGKSKTARGGLLGFATRAAGGVAGVTSESTDYEIGITLKVLDATSGENIATISADATATGNKKFAVAGGGILGSAVGGAFGKSATGEREKRLGEAMQRVATAGAVKLVQKRESGAIAK